MPAAIIIKSLNPPAN